MQCLRWGVLAAFGGAQVPFAVLLRICLGDFLRVAPADRASPKWAMEAEGRAGTSKIWALDTEFFLIVRRCWHITKLFPRFPVFEEQAETLTYCRALYITVRIPMPS